MRHAALFLFLAVALASAGDETCETGKKAESEPAKKMEQATVTGASGMVATIDETRGEDGSVQLSPQMRAAIANMVNTSSEGLKEVVKDDGTVIVDLEGRFQSAMVVSIGPDGKMISTCYSSLPEHTCKADKHAAPPATKGPKP